MSLGTVKIGKLSISRMIVGGNPFSGFSHQSWQRDLAMRHYYTTAKIKDALRRAEQAGINAHVSRCDHHVMRYLMEYRDEGGTLQWIAQTCPEVASASRCVDNAIQGQAAACFLHGGFMDHCFANGQLDEVAPAIEKIQKAGMPAGIAAHEPRVIEWAQKNLAVDFYMCSYYNPIPRHKSAEHQAGAEEVFDPADRQAMVDLIAKLTKPAIHYKVMAAGRNDPREALSFVARHLRPNDAVCVGVFLGDKPDMLAEDVRILEEAMAAKGR